MGKAEGKIQAAAMKEIRKHRGFAHKCPQNATTPVGVPDVVACVPVKLARLNKLYKSDAYIGLFVGLEMKDIGKMNNVSEAQFIKGREIKKAGGIWIPADSTELVQALIMKLQGEDYEQ